MTRADDTLEDLPETVGQPMPQIEVSIRDPQTNAVVPFGAAGEICARGYHVMLGYNDNPDATAAAIDADGWLHTGDLGTMDARGYVQITGRVKEMIIRGGENLFPAEIENVLFEHADVAEVAVVGVPDDTLGRDRRLLPAPDAGARSTGAAPDRPLPRSASRRRRRPPTGSRSTSGRSPAPARSRSSCSASPSSAASSSRSRSRPSNRTRPTRQRRGGGVE